MAKKLKGISHFYDNQEPSRVKGSIEPIVREAFLRSSRETLDNFGIDEYSIGRINGMIEMLEQFNIIQGEL